MVQPLSWTGLSLRLHGRLLREPGQKISPPGAGARRPGGAPGGRAACPTPSCPLLTGRFVWDRQVMARHAKRGAFPPPPRRGSSSARSSGSSTSKSGSSSTSGVGAGTCCSSTAGSAMIIARLHLGTRLGVNRPGACCRECASVVGSPAPSAGPEGSSRSSPTMQMPPQMRRPPIALLDTARGQECSEGPALRAAGTRSRGRPR
eukprot:scaffold1827_cov421-Prasinococcus_capsulatus_cf.AAC.37